VLIFRFFNNTVTKNFHNVAWDGKMIMNGE
jgi:hypothetical protein